MSKYDPDAAAAKRIVRRLFPYEATRLEVKRGPRVGEEIDLGGWCKRAVEDIVREELQKVKR